MTRVLIAGLSARAAAESAVRAGFDVTAIDAFADLDLPSGVCGLSLPRDFGTGFTAASAARVAAGISSDASVYLSNFENHPDAVDALAAGRTLWGNPSSVLRRVRDPLQLADAFRRHGVPTPALQLGPWNDPDSPNALSPGGAWLVKPLASGGGRGVRPWTGGDVPADCYLQERIAGVPGSVVFVAAGGRAVPLGVSRQLVGDATCGADGYRYCGNILAPPGDPQFESGVALVSAASALARIAAEEFDLVGLNGIDIVATGGVPYPIEVNPRWCASMELVERARGVSMFGLHAAACSAGTLPAFDLTDARRRLRAVGKAIVFAHRDVTMGDTRPWLEDPGVRDVPHPGQRIAAGHPVCTVLAEGADAGACEAALMRRAERIYTSLTLTS